MAWLDQVAALRSACIKTFGVAATHMPPGADEVPIMGIIQNPALAEDYVPGSAHGVTVVRFFVRFSDMNPQPAHGDQLLLNGVLYDVFRGRGRPGGRRGFEAEAQTCLTRAPSPDAIVAAMQSIPDLVAAMGGDPGAITAFHYQYGADHRLQEHVYQIAPPGILVAWKGTLGGSFDGQTLFKHRFDVYIRSANAALDPSTAGPERLWALICNGTMPDERNIRQVQLLPEVDIMEPPSVAHQQDEEQMDFFVGTLVIPEIGDN